MKCELFSVRSVKDEIESVDAKTNSLISALRDNGVALLYKTDVDPTSVSMENALKNSAGSSDAPELIIIANAISDTDKSSFISLFEQAITNLDETSGEDTLVRNLGDFGNGYPAFYFTYQGIHIIVLPRTQLCGGDIIDMSLAALEKIKKYTAETSEVTEISDETLTENTEPEKKKKKGFIKSFIPQKEDKTGVKVSKVMVIVFTLVFIAAAAMLANELIILPTQNKQKNNTIRDIFDKRLTSSYVPENPYNIELDEEDKYEKDWNAVRKINSDICGWIRIKNLNDDVVNYPVLYSTEMDGENYFYVYHDYKKEYARYGSIFIDPASADSIKDRIMVLHGHHMRDGSMFASLVDYGLYSGDLETFKKAPIITIEYPDGDKTRITKWYIFSVIKATINRNDLNYFDYCNTKGLQGKEFMEYIYQAKVRSLFDVPIPINENDRIIALSTCSYEYDNYRTVVFARELRSNESVASYTNHTELNYNPLWPDNYYKDTGYSPVNVSSFNEAYANGEISWYDGKLYQ